jgi:hypothetical protein
VDHTALYYRWLSTIVVDRETILYIHCPRGMISTDTPPIAAYLTSAIDSAHNRTTASMFTLSHYHLITILYTTHWSLPAITPSHYVLRLHLNIMYFG